MSFTLNINHLLQLLILLSSLAVLAHSRNNSISKLSCEKYCFQDCSQYMDQNKTLIVWSEKGSIHSFNEYLDCKWANSWCRCESLSSYRNTLLWIRIIFGAILGISVVYYFFKYCWKSKRNSRLSSRAAYINPIVPSTISTGNFNDPHFNGHHVAYPPVSEAPPEYIPPPTYYECIERDITRDRTSNELVSK